MVDEPQPAPAIGIDLGTTFCCVGVYINGQVRIIPNLESGDNTTPSYVYFEPEGEAVIGNPAKSNAFRNPENTIFDVKRILGREFKNPDLQNDMKFWPFTVQEGDEDIPMVKVNGELLYPEEISAKLLAKLRSFAETFLQLDAGTIKKAVITVPAYFHDGQRQATIDAGELAGLEVLTILNEPTAAAIAYSLQRFDTKPKKILVYDLGGGTFDVAVLNIEQNKIEVLGVNGDTHLGGEDFDRKMMEQCVSRFEKETGIDLLDGKDSTDDNERQNVRRNLRRLQTYCENAKSYLTNGHQTKVSVDVMTNGKDLFVELKRSQFEDMNEAYFKRTIDLVDSTLKELGLSKDEIDDIVLVGGSTRIPMVKQLLKEYFGGKSLNQSIHPDQAVAYGAAIQAAVMTGEKSLGHIKFDKIQDVTPMPLGTGVFPDRFKMIIPKGTKFPVEMSTVVGTLHDNQTSANIHVFQGNDFVASNNRLLGEFVLDGIPPKKAGEEELDITMEINDMGVLHVSAECRSIHRRSDITIKENKNRMSKETKEKLLAKGKQNVSAHDRLSRLLSK